MDTLSETGPAKAVSQLSQSLAQAAQSQRDLVGEITAFTKDESLRFASQRLERNGQALEKLSTCTGLPGLIGLQQEWLRELAQDYADQTMRLAGAWRGVAHTVVSEATDAASQTVDRMQAHATDMAHQAQDVAEETADTVQQAAHETGEQMADFSQDLNNNYVQH